MPDRLITAQEAREMIEGPSPAYEEFGEVDKFSYKALATIIAQAEQIKRIQKAVTTLLADLNEAEFGIYSEFETYSTPPFKPITLDEYIKAEDMEEK